MRTMPSEPIKGRVKTVKLTNSETKKAIIGMVLGDGCLSRYKGRKGNKVGNAYFQMSHGIKQHEYLLWKKGIIENITRCKVYRNDSKGGISTKPYLGYHLSSSPHPTFTKLYDRFYQYDKKSVDEYLLKMIDPLALAIIFMDDGCLGKAMPKYWTKETCYLSLCNFDYANLFLIKKSLKLSFDLDWNINKQSLKPNNPKRYYNLRLLNRDNQKFFDIVRPYIEQVPCMAYKLGSYAKHS